MSRPRREILEDEWLMVRHSGEIPEIVLHSAYYYLTEDPDGPRLQLRAQEIRSLQEAAAARYQEIILRDLCYENRHLPVYRGVQRAIFNWHRFVAFCQRQDSACHNLRRTTADALLVLLQKAVQTTDQAIPSPDRSGAFIFNCTFHDLTLFAREMGITEGLLPADLRLFCRQ